MPAALQIIVCEIFGSFEQKKVFKADEYFLRFTLNACYGTCLVSCVE